MFTHIHIVSFDVPFPPNYGGVIDIYYKLRALSSLGIKIHLHCFDYGRGKANKLYKYCEEVHYYRRQTNKLYLLSTFPYIVISRTSNELMKNLLKDDCPILFEGLHCCFYLNDPRLEKRKKIVRMHNIEHTYYSQLASIENNIFRKQFFKTEAKKLKKFELILKHANAIASISPADTQELSARYKNVVNIMAFHPHRRVESLEGIGSYALYHGNLAVGENNKAALYLANEIFNRSVIPFIIAGNRASKELKQAIRGKSNIILRENISSDEIYELVRNAQVNILPTFQSTGIKLKMLAALFCGRHCLVNTPMVSNTGVESLCVIADTANAMQQKLSELMLLPFTNDAKQLREKVLNEKFDNSENAKKLAGLFL